LIGLVAGLVIIIKLDKQKKPIKPGVLIMVASFVISLIGIPFVPSVPTQASLSNTNAQSTEISKDDSEDKAKKEAEAKAKAEEDTKAKIEAEAEEKAKAEDEAKKKAEEEAAKKEAEEVSHNIGMNPEQLKTAFNKASKNIGIDLRIGNFKIEEGAVQNTFKNSFTKNLSMVGMVNKKDGSVRSVTFIGAGDGTAKSGADIILSMGLTIMATNPELSEDDRGNILRELGLMDGGDVFNLNKDTIRNGIKYSLNTSKELGIWFTVSSANDE